MRRITNEPWFGPKKYVGWGWTARTWQGWVVSAVFVALFVEVLAVAHRGRASVVAALVIVVVFLGVVMLTGAPPGGPRSRRR